MFLYRYTLLIAFVGSIFLYQNSSDVFVEPDVDIEVKLPVSQHKIESLTLQNSGQALLNARRISLKNAKLRDFAVIPRFSETLAVKVLRYRKQHAEIRNFSELLDISGMGRKKLKALQLYFEL